MKAILDTHTLLWWFEASGHLNRKQKKVIAKATPDAPLYVSDITQWEVATLAERGRIRLALPLRDWLERACAPPLVIRVGISPAIAAEVANLPRTFHRDPADRIIVSTARVLGATLLTSDRRVVEAGIVPTL